MCIRDSVPIPHLFEFLTGFLLPHMVPIPIPHFISCLQICMAQNVFTFRNNFFRQIFGTSMGGSLSPIIANIYMEFFETRLLPRAPLYSQVFSWKRYVDDVLAIVPNSFSIDQFLEQINVLTPTITFTSEGQNEGCI